MAQDQNGSAEEAAAERKPTERVVLQQIEVLEIPADVSADSLEAAVQALTVKKRKPVRSSAWVEVARRTAPSKVAAIESYAGKAGTPDAKQGTFRAPTVTSWKDGLVYEAPPEPLVERSTVD